MPTDRQPGDPEHLHLLTTQEREFIARLRAVRAVFPLVETVVSFYVNPTFDQRPTDGSEFSDAIRPKPFTFAPKETR